MVESFIIAWNEEDTIGLTIDYYKRFGPVNLFDNFSTDRTREIAEEHGAKVMLFGQQGILSDKAYLKVKNHCWKTSKADWVIVCDADEVLWHHELEKVLNEEKGTIFNTYGWNVYSHEIPGSWLDVTSGIHAPNFSKKIIFRPTLQAINYEYGCHRCEPRGDVRYSDIILTVFHYRNVGGPQRLCNRHKIYRERMSPLNRELKLGHHYLQEDQRRIREWNEFYEKSKTYSPDFAYSLQGPVHLNP